MSYDMDFLQGGKMFKADDLNSLQGGSVIKAPCFVFLLPASEAMFSCKEVLFLEKRRFLEE